MKPIKIIAVVLIIAGFLVVATGGFNYSQKKKVVDTDVIDISTRETKSFPIPRIIGGILVVAGIVVLLVPPAKKD